MLHCIKKYYIFHCCVKNFIAFSATGHLCSAAFCFFSFSSHCFAFSFPIQNIFICCALHSFCCEYILSHYIKEKLHSIAMHFNACAPQKKLKLLFILIHVLQKKIPNCCFMFCLPTAVRVSMLCIFLLSRCCSLHFSAAIFSSLCISVHIA